MITARYFSSNPSDSGSLRTPCPPGNAKRWLQVRLGCNRLSPLCPFRLLHTLLLSRPARHYPRFWIQRPSSERRGDFNPHDSCAAQRTSGRRRRPLKGLPPSAAQTARAVFPQAAFMNGLSRSEEKVSESGPSASDPRADDRTVSLKRDVRVFRKGNFPSSRSFLINLDFSRLEPFTNGLPRTTLDPPLPVTRVIRLALQVLFRSPTPA